MRKEEIEEVVRIAAAEVLVRREEIIKDEYDARYQDDGAPPGPLFPDF